MLTHRVPYPPDRGDRIRSWHILKHLSKTNRISLACVSEEDVSYHTLEKLESYCEQVTIAPIHHRWKWGRACISFAHGRSLTDGLFWSPKLSQQLDKWSLEEPFDAVFVFCSSMLRYSRLNTLRNVPSFVDLVDVDSLKFHQYADDAKALKRAIYRSEGYRVHKMEQDAVNVSEAVTLVSDAEATLLRNKLKAPNAPVFGIENGVDEEYFSPDFCQIKNAPGTCGELSTTTDSAAHSHKYHLVFIGVLNYPPNTEALKWFIDNVWPTLKKNDPLVTLNIVGKHPTTQIRKMEKIEGVTVTGAVPDVRPHLNNAKVVIAPLQLARGIQNKVLEAMSMQRAVVVTPAAATGINARNGKQICIAGSKEEWVVRIQELLSNETTRNEIAANARKLICNEYSWEAKLTKLTDLINERLVAQAKI